MVATLFRFVRLLSLVLWIGGIALFAFVVAPIAFGRLPNAHEAGLVVGGTLQVLHWLGLVCGGVFLALTLIANGRRVRSWRHLAAECLLDIAMMAITAYSQFGVLPAMARYRAEVGGTVAAASEAAPARRKFEQIHKTSEQLEGAVLIAGSVYYWLWRLKAVQSGR